MEDDKSIKEVLNFWFGKVPGEVYSIRDMLAAVSRFPYWYGKAFVLLGLDDVMAVKYRTLVERARAGEFECWETQQEGRLALILLLDQFPRNIYRGTDQAFKSDQKAFRLAEKSIELGDDLLVHSLARTFYYFPLMHQEDIGVQNRCVDLCKKNLEDANLLNIGNVCGTYLSSLRHRQIIKKFGRYPHRNIMLGRNTTSEEARFLKQPFSEF